MRTLPCAGLLSARRLAPNERVSLRRLRFVEHSFSFDEIVRIVVALALETEGSESRSGPHRAFRFRERVAKPAEVAEMTASASNGCSVSVPRGKFSRA